MLERDGISLSNEDSFDALWADILSSKEGMDAARRVVYDEVEDWMNLAADFGRKMLALDDVLKAHVILIDALLVIKEANKRISKEVAAKSGPKDTKSGFSR